MSDIKETPAVAKSEKPVGGWIKLSLGLFMAYALVLALAALSELFGLGWFDNPIFK